MVDGKKQQNTGWCSKFVAIDLLGLVYNTEQIDEFVETGLDHPDLNYRERCRLTNEYKIQMII